MFVSLIYILLRYEETNDDIEPRVADGVGTGRQAMG